MADPKRKQTHKAPNAQAPRDRRRHRQGRWLPSQDDLEDWLEGLADEIRDKVPEAELHPAVDALRELINTDPIAGMYVTQMIGMDEVSSCVIGPTIQPGHRVKKGDEVGYFQFGGSSYCLLFRPDTIEEFAINALPQPENPEPPLVLLGAKIATAK